MLSVTSVTATGFMVTTQVAFFVLSAFEVTVMVAEPTILAVTSPLWSTSAMPEALLLHVTVLSVASSGATVAVSVSVAPCSNVVDVLLSVTLVTGMALTVTAQVAVFELSEFDVTVMVAEPTALAVTVPASTVAMSVSLLLHVRVLSVALSGATVTVRVPVALGNRLNVVSLRVTAVTATVLTVTTQVPFTPFTAVAVMVVEPSARPFTTPSLFTVATASLLLLHVRVGSVALSGATVAVKVAASLMGRMSVGSLNVTLVTATGITVTTQVPFTPLAVVAVIVAEPTASAVTVPSSNTVITAGLLPRHVRALSDALSGATVAVSASVLPMGSVRVGGVMVTPVASTSPACSSSHDMAKKAVAITMAMQVRIG